ncbi:hypothetical protein FACS1894130_01260 [Spirochaetia bacterium]|nr:hypothetical protein FACS1894130_01260 [Spirochaetia bacterium]
MPICKPIVPDIASVIQQCNTLNKYGVAPRYPRKIDINDNDVSQALLYAGTILDFTKSNFPKKTPEDVKG